MRDIAFLGFFAILFWFALRRPFLLVLAFVYVDILAPQRLAYLLLNLLPISLICFVLAFGSWLFVGDKSDARFSPRQWLLSLLLIYCWATTQSADFPVEAAEKWSWVWKSLVFAIFLPLTLRTRLRMEALVVFMVLSAAPIIIVGGIKTLATGGGYGSLNLMVTNNTGIYESSTIAMVSMAIIPLILFVMKHGTIFPQPDWRPKLFCYALIFSCLLIPIGTQARTGLICGAVLLLMSLRFVKRPALYLMGACVLALVAYPLLPKSFTDRMSTIKGYEADSSASTRIQVWKWTMDYAQDHPFGGGFNAFLQNEFRYEITERKESHGSIQVERKQIVDKGRAYHNSYFEMLGEQGYPGLVLWLIINLLGLFRMEALYRRFKNRSEDHGHWISPLASALQMAHMCYLVGSMFVGMAFQSFVYMLIGLQMALDIYAGKIREKENWRPMREEKRGFQNKPKSQGGLTTAP